jgi:hypothetical protein
VRERLDHREVFAELGELLGDAIDGLLGDAFVDDPTG